MIINLIKLNHSFYVIEKEGTGEAKEIGRLENESKEDYLTRVKKIYNNVANRYKELNGKEIK